MKGISYKFLLFIHAVCIVEYVSWQKFSPQCIPNSSYILQSKDWKKECFLCLLQLNKTQDEIFQQLL